jgi:hypothetical protein
MSPTLICQPPIGPRLGRHVDHSRIRRRLDERLDRYGDRLHLVLLPAAGVEASVGGVCFPSPPQPPLMIPGLEDAEVIWQPLVGRQSRVGCK